MVTIGDVVRTVEACFPLSYQESYDNSGLQVGDVTQPLRGIMPVSYTHLDVYKRQG